MSNCLFESAYETILKRCNCTPSFHQLAYRDYPNICRGPGLTCMNDILRFIGKLNQVRLTKITFVPYNSGNTGGGVVDGYRFVCF